LIILDNGLNVCMQIARRLRTVPVRAVETVKDRSLRRRGVGGAMATGDVVITVFLFVCAFVLLRPHGSFTGTDDTRSTSTVLLTILVCVPILSLSNFFLTYQDLNAVLIRFM
jgi:hypothetical protein